MTENFIEVSGLKKSFKTNQVLKDVDFTVGKGSIFALLGSKILSTLIKPDGGKATINGFDVVRQETYVRGWCDFVVCQSTANDTGH